MFKIVPVFFIFCFSFNLARSYIVDLTNTGPVVAGATITFKSELFDNYKQNINADQNFIFQWRDNAMPPHTGRSSGYFTESYWNTSYPTPGRYEVEVTIFVSSIIYDRPIASARQYFNITLLLNGNMALQQNNSTIDSSKPYASTASPVLHEIVLSDPDASYLKKNATEVLTYWFVDCVYYGVTDDMRLEMNYTNQVGQQKHIEALVIASYVEPTLPPPTVPSTVVPNSTTPALPTTPTNTTQPAVVNATDVLAVNSSTTLHSAPTTPSTEILATNSSINSTSIPVPPMFVPDLLKNVTLIKGKNYMNSHEFPYVCINSSIIPTSGKETYGYFKRSVGIKDPVENVSFTGTNWLKQGDMLNLGVNCNGSSPFLQCVQMHIGEYNVTGNETCDTIRILTDCKFSIVHYFRSAETYTLVIIINNEVSKIITPVAVNIYEVTKHPQLSVIIVPVVFSTIAVILIVFGIAYYIQSRNRYTVEVADFDFAQTSDMEYKTFSERLRDAMSSAINRTQDYVEEGNVWSPSRKYGSMQ